MITISLSTEELRAKGACTDGMELFRAIAGEAGKVTVENWTNVHGIWLLLAYPSFYSWLVNQNLIPATDLRGANLYAADLRGANLRVANLYAADLRGADLRSADLYDANLRSADLYDANLRGAYRGSDTNKIPGWHTSVRGYLERDSE